MFYQSVWADNTDHLVLFDRHRNLVVGQGRAP